MVRLKVERFDGVVTKKEKVMLWAWQENVYTSNEMEVYYGYFEDRGAEWIFRKPFVVTVYGVWRALYPEGSNFPLPRKWERHIEEEIATDCAALWQDGMTELPVLIAYDPYVLTGRKPIMFRFYMRDGMLMGEMEGSSLYPADNLHPNLPELAVLPWDIDISQEEIDAVVKIARQHMDGYKCLLVVLL